MIILFIFFILRTEWREILSSLSNNLEKLRQLSFNGELKISKFRSLCWSLLLRVLNENSSNWNEQRQQQRTRSLNIFYIEKKKKSIIKFIISDMKI